MGGTVTGLASGKTLVLRNNGGDELSITANGEYAFPTPLASGAMYAATIIGTPPGQSCGIINTNGTIGSSNVSNVNVFCYSLSYKVGGTISGLQSGKSVYLTSPGLPNFTFSSNGPFTMPGTTLDGQPYSVSIAFQPSGELCTIQNGSGTINAADVTDISIDCKTAYTVGGTIATLAAAKSVVLQDNGADDTTLNGPFTLTSFTMKTPVVDGGSYDVKVAAQPAGQTCKVSKGSGTISGAAVNDVQVVCTQLTVALSGVTSLVGAPNLNLSVYVFSGNTLLAGRSSLSVDGSGNGSYLMSTASSTASSATIYPVGFAAPLLDGDYSVFVQADKTNNGIAAANADDSSYFGKVTVSGPTTLTLDNASFKQYVSFGPSFSGQPALAGMNYYCAAHLPGVNVADDFVFNDFVQRTLFGTITGSVDGSGNGSLVKAVVAQGTFDFRCMVDNPNASTIGVELQPFSVSTGKGVDAGYDYVAESKSVNVQAAGTTSISGFSLATLATGSVACAGSYTSGGNGNAGGSFNGNNNSALLTGSAGCVAGTAAGVHKTISVETPTGSGANHYTFSSVAYLENRAGDSFTMVVPLTNTSGAARGGIFSSFNDVVIKNSGGSSAGSTFFAKIAGATCTAGTSTFSTCLGAGETGYLVVTASGYAAASSVAIAITDSAQAVTGINSKVIPQTFTRYSDGELRIRATNQGTGNADFSTLATSNNSFVITFDENGNPSDWTTLNYNYVDHVITSNHVVGTTGPKSSIVLWRPANAAPIDIASPKIKVFLNYGDTTTAPN